mmetsp:Transcript_18447/g.47232  ORF Transcript_18447/g.47232 Transcript_18447/m.47232 type:complete len:201 (-) Transcript_18447:968-1570(-)
MLSGSSAASCVAAASPRMRSITAPAISAPASHSERDAPTISWLNVTRSGGTPLRRMSVSTAHPARGVAELQYALMSRLNCSSLLLRSKEPSLKRCCVAASPSSAPPSASPGRPGCTGCPPPYWLNCWRCWRCCRERSFCCISTPSMILMRCIMARARCTSPAVAHALSRFMYTRRGAVRRVRSSYSSRSANASSTASDFP